MHSGLIYEEIIPTGKPALFVDSFWSLRNESGHDIDVIILPDGRIDASFGDADGDSFMLHSLENQASQAAIPAGIRMFAISFKFLAAEYLFKQFAPVQPDEVRRLPFDFWGVPNYPYTALTEFSEAFSKVIDHKLDTAPDPRKVKLSDLLYTSHGAATVAELADAASWSSRQINRYFQQYLGMPLKNYASILRFRASFGHIKAGKLFPGQEFADQSHFIREIKRYAGVVPKELAKNQNDRFIQFSTLPKP